MRKRVRTTQGLGVPVKTLAEAGTPEWLIARCIC